MDEIENELQVIAFQNTNDYPVSLNITGIRGKVCLYEGDRILDREGIPIIPPQSVWSWLISKGVKPVHLKSTSEKTSRLISTEDFRLPIDRIGEEVILDDQKLMEAKIAAKPIAVINELLPPAPVTLPTGAPDQAPVSHLNNPHNPDPVKADLVWQDPDGNWIFNKDGVADLNPAFIKKHIRKTYGKEYLESVEWRAFGAPAIVSEVRTTQELSS